MKSLASVAATLFVFCGAPKLALGASVDDQDDLFLRPVLSETMTMVSNMSYVMEPFEQMELSANSTWFFQPSGKDNSLLNVTLIDRNSTSRQDDVMFGDKAVRVEYTLPLSTTPTAGAIGLGWIQAADKAPHNCHGAHEVSLWYRHMYQPPADALTKLQVTLLLDLAPYSVTHSVVLDQGASTLWKELKIPVQEVDMRRVRGWKAEVKRDDTQSTTSTASGGTLWLDQLACHGNGNLFGAPFFVGTDLDTALSEGLWRDTFYQSNISRDNTVSVLDGIHGQLAVNYTLEQVESWGGFLEFHHLAPAHAYYNLSGNAVVANTLLIPFRVVTTSSIPERAIFRFVPQDNSDCTHDCDTDFYQQERYYSFHPILDAAGRGQIVLPLVASDSPDTPLWLTGWSGITGNGVLDVQQLKGYTLELVLDSQLEIGQTLTGAVVFGAPAAVFDSVPWAPPAVGGADDTARCVVEPGLQFFEFAPYFKRVEFLGSRCCEECQNDPDCAYALSTGIDCLMANQVEKDHVQMLSTTSELETLTAFWIDSAAKRGDFCDLCICNLADQLVNCRGRNLTVVPKTIAGAFYASFKPTKLDLRENPQLVLLGSGALDVMADTLEELWLPTSIRHVSPDTFDLPRLNSIHLEGNDVNNMIQGPDGAFGDVCCSRGMHVDLAAPLGGVTFCDMRVHYPGVDSVYLPFMQFWDAEVLQQISPSSDFMAEASESVEKCAEYCTVDSDCRYFSYDARLPNAENYCSLLGDNGTKMERVCCNPDNYADENGTIPGWISGVPPRTRQIVDGAAILLSGEDLIVEEANGFTAVYSLSLGSNPIRGAVWVFPTLVSAPVANVVISPQQVVLYDANQTITVTVQVLNVAPGTQAGTVVMKNVVVSCDEAFMSSLTEDTVFINVVPPKGGSPVNIAAAVALPILALVVLLLVLWVLFERARKQHDDVWKVDRSDLIFSDPPTVIGRGTFGLVLLAEYRGTQVAVKRVIPPKSNKGIQIDGFKSGVSFDTAENSDSNDDNGKASPEKRIVGTSSWAGATLASGIHGKMSGLQGKKSGISMLKSSPVNSAQRWRNLKVDFIAEMRQLSKLRHPCITTVMGAVIGNGVEPMLVMEYLSHGSLYDLLHNETMALEGELLLPILRDISQGMRFLHSARPEVIHGDLKAQNVLVDHKFCAKIADFGLSQKKHVGATGTPFWMAPELLRGESSNTTASDVYSYGIILYEVFSRRDPYEGENPKKVLKLVADSNVNKRPPVPHACPSKIQSLMADCLDADPANRPTFEELDTRLKRIDAENVNTDHATSKKSAVSLFDIFPRHIAEALRDGKPVEAEHKDEVTIFFSDIVGFTTISSTLPPRKVATMLDRLYAKFDALSHKHDIFKVETIGDAYMCVTNLVKDQHQDHAKRIANFAIEAIAAANETCIDEDDPEKTINIRVGFHSGNVVADVVGTRNPRYCLFGDTVNTASRMESNSLANRIHCSAASADLLKVQWPSLGLVSRGMMEIKGKGEMHTYWVNEVESKPLRVQHPLPGSVDEVV